MLGYLNSESPFDSEGWFNTKDKVEVKGEYIKILGRASELINVGGQKVFPTEIENVVLEVPGVIDVLAYGSDNSIMGKVVNLKVYTTFENTVELSNQIKKYCTEKLEKYKRPVKIEFVSSSFESERFKKKRV
jgi:acyl-CoA synthetase (AMP-forming)/AMP-acid ligase II